MSEVTTKKKRQRPAGKWIAVSVLGFLFAVLCIVLSLVWMNRNQNNAAASLPVVDPNRVEGTAGGEGTPAYNQKIKEYGDEQAALAQQQGQTHISPISGGSGPQELLLEDFSRQTAQNQGPPPPMNMEAVDTSQRPYQGFSNAEETARRREEMLQSSIENALKEVAKRSVLTGHSSMVFDDTKKDVPASATAAGGTQTAQAGGQVSGQSDKPALPVKLGEALYAVVDQVLNSDHPAPSFRATIIAGPAEGYRTFGKFERKDDVMVLTFTRMISPEGIAYDIDGYGIDPATSEVAFASDVNYHFWAKTGAIITLSGAKFIEGFGNAVSRSGSVTTTVGTGGSTEVAQNKDYNTNELAWQAAGETAGVLAGITEKIADKTLNRPPTVRLNAGETVGIVILGLK